MEIFSKRLRELRTQKGEQQADIAQILKVSPQSYSAYENGREPGYVALTKIAEHYDVSIDYLLGRADAPNAEHVDIVKQTTLSPKAVNRLINWKEYQTSTDKQSKILNFLIENEWESNLFEKLYDYLLQRYLFPELHDDMDIKAFATSKTYPSAPLISVNRGGEKGVRIVESADLNDMFFVKVQESLMELKKKADNIKEDSDNAET